MDEPPEVPRTLTLALEAGDFAWVLGTSGIWWPARVRADADVPYKPARDPRDGSQLFVTCFGDGPSGWYSVERLKPFERGFVEFARQSDQKGFMKAVEAAANDYGRCVEAELTCGHIAEEVASKLKCEMGSRRIEEMVANVVPEEVVKTVRGVALDVCSRSVLEVAVTCGWIAAFSRRVLGRYAPLAEFNAYMGLPQVEDLAVGEIEEWEDGGKKQRSMAELIADLDLETVGKEEEDSMAVATADEGVVVNEREEEEGVDSKNTIFRDLNDAVPEEGLGGGRRERKKSKYLSPPYTLMTKGSRVVGTKSSEKKSVKIIYNLDLNDGDGQMEKASSCRMTGNYRSNWFGEDIDFLLDEKTPPVDSLLMELQLAALSVMYLEGSENARVVRGFFGKHRQSVCACKSKVEVNDVSQAEKSGVDMKSPRPKYISSPKGRKVQLDISVKDKKAMKGKKRSNPIENGTVEVKQQSYSKKKAIGGIVGCKTVESSHPEIHSLDGEKPAQNRNGKNKDGANSSKEALHIATAVHGSNGTREDEPLKEKHGEEMTCNSAGITPVQNADMVINGSVEGESTMNRDEKNKNQVNSDLGLATIANVCHEADGSEEVTSSEKMIGEKRTEENGDVGLIPAVNILQVGTGAEGKNLAENVNRSMEQGRRVIVDLSVTPVNLAEIQKQEESVEVGSTLSVPVGQEAVVLSDRKSPKNAARKRKPETNADGATNVEGKPKQKRQRQKKEGASATKDGAPAVSTAGYSSLKTKQKRRKEEKGATLLLSFSKDAELPSREDLITTYSKFGTLSESDTILMKDTSSASVVFTKKSDAEKAFDSTDRDRALGSNIAGCELRCISGNPSTPAPSLTLTPRPTLEDVKKNLESMISTLAASGMNVKDFLGSDGGLKMDLRENLVGEMSGLLKKVNSFLGGGPPPAGGGTTDGPTTA